MKSFMFQFAQAYGEGVYGGNTYSCTTEQFERGECSTTTGGGPTTPGGTPGGGLVDTGVATIALVTLACLLIFTGLIVRIWRRPAVVPQELPVYIPENQDDEPTKS